MQWQSQKLTVVERERESGKPMHIKWIKMQQRIYWTMDGCEYGNTVHAASTITGKEKPDMWDALLTLIVLFQGRSIATRPANYH
jgi:hypothetical protein